MYQGMKKSVMLNLYLIISERVIIID
jgi:hypothetical protein